MTSIQSLQRSFATCQAYTLQVMAGRGARALGVGTRSKVPFQGHEGWAPCHPGPASWGQKLASRSCDLEHHSQVAELDSDPRGLAVTSTM